MICTLLKLAILSPDPAVIDHLLWSRHNLTGRAAHLVVRAYLQDDLAETSEGYLQTVTVLGQAGGAARIKLADGREIYTRYAEDLHCG